MLQGINQTCPAATDQKHIRSGHPQLTYYKVNTSQVGKGKNCRNEIYYLQNWEQMIFVNDQNKETNGLSEQSSDASKQKYIKDVHQLFFILCKFYFNIMFSA